MDILELWKNEGQEEKRIEELYTYFDEESRLSLGSGRIEFLTTVHYIEKMLKPGMKILDIGAGTGAYSLYFANKGYEVTAIELTKRNCDVFASKLYGDESIRLHQASALDLSFLGAETFDVVLLLGPLYHIEKETDRLRAIMEARRVMKKEGTIFLATINHDMVPYTETMRNPLWFNNNTYDHDTFRLVDIPFIFHTLEESRKMLQDTGLVLQREIASDGMSELLGAQLEEMDAESFHQYLRYHLLHCEDKEGLGRTNHFLFQCGQRESIDVSYPDDEDVLQEMKEIQAYPVDDHGFHSFIELEQGDINLLKVAHKPAEPEKNWVPSYHFEIRQDTTPVGKIDLRLGYTEGLYYGGNLGYEINEEHRGKGYAVEACRLIKKVALRHGMQKILITTDYRNQASRRVCEKLGAKLIRIIALPEEHDLYKEGGRFESIYLWDLEEE